MAIFICILHQNCSSRFIKVSIQDLGRCIDSFMCGVRKKKLKQFKDRHRWKSSKKKNDSDGKKKNKKGNERRKEKQRCFLDLAE